MTNLVNTVNITPPNIPNLNKLAKKLEKAISLKPKPVKPQKPWPCQQPLSFNSKDKTNGKSEAVARKKIKFLALDDQPFSVFEGRGFRSLIHFLRCGYTIPSRRHFSDVALLELFVVSWPTQAATRLYYFSFASRQL